MPAQPESPPAGVRRGAGRSSVLGLAAAVVLSQCATPAKSIPPTMDKETWTSTDGKVMPYARWPKDQGKPADVRAVVICVHGLSGAASDFWPAGELLQERRFAVYGMQLRGQGNDPDKASRGDISSASAWTGDLQAFTEAVRCRHPNIPVYWYGESLGSLIVSHALGAQDGGKATVDGIILSSPIIGFRQEVPWWKYWLIRGVAAVWPSKRIALESLGDSEVKVTNDTTHKQQMEKTDHYVQYFTLRLFREIEKMVRGSGGLAPKFHVPILLFYTPNDVFTSREQVEEFYDRLGSKDKTKIFYPDSYHLLLHDKDRPNVLKELDHWFQRLAGEKK